MALHITPAIALETRVENRQQLLALKKDLDEQIDAESAEIKAELMARGLDTLAVGDYTVTLTARERKTLDKGALVQLGVGTDVIAKATKTSEYVQLDVRLKKERG